jgi:cytochrome c-type biogenesis protein
MNSEVIFTSLTLGLLSSTSPCVLPLYPGFLAYLSGRQDEISSRYGRYTLGFFVLAGVLSMMMALGFLISLLAVPIGAALSIVIPLADLMIIALGIALLFNFNPFKVIPQIQVPILRNPYINAYVYGLLYGPIALPCCGPLVVGMFAYSLTAGEFLGKFNVFLWFGIGFGLPLLMLSFMSGASQRWLVRLFAQHARLINVIGGILLIGIGLYDLYVNKGLILTYLR